MAGKVPKRAITRTAKLATLPLGLAGRAAVGAGRRLGGAPAEAVAAQIQARTAEQLFSVLGELKGGAMKVGQAMSILEAAMPEEVARPYRATLTKLQDSAPPLPAAVVHEVLAREFGYRWRTRFQEFDDHPAASASIGQVHRALWRDGREVAVKIQYPDAGPALVGDIKRLARVTKVSAGWIPGLDLDPLLAELIARVEEELDYALEAEHQRVFGSAFTHDPHVHIPAVVYQRGTVLVTEWMGGTPLARVIESGTPQERSLAATRYLEFLVSGPQRARLLHADPHPGNFRILPDGRLGVLDFGSVDDLPDGLPEAMGRLITTAVRDDASALAQGLREEGFLREGIDADPSEVLQTLLPFVDCVRGETYTFRRAWLREQYLRFQDPRRQDWRTSLKLNLPADYLLIHRVWAGGVGVLCQIEGEVPARALIDAWLPGADLGAAPRLGDDAEPGDGQGERS